MKRTLSYTLAIVAASTAALGAAYAAMAPHNDAVAILTSKTGLGQAVAVAEGHVGGKAVSAEYERTTVGQWVFDIEVVKGTTVMDVTVDADSGRVLAAVVDKDDDNDMLD